MEDVVREFSKIIKVMALVCTTKEQFIEAKNNYTTFVSKEGMYIKDGTNVMMRYLEL